MGNLTDLFRKMSMHKKMMIIIITLMMVTLFTGYLHHIVPKIGKNAGKVTGNVVGLAVGSADGLFNGLSEGAEAGAEVGLSAEDTNAEIKGIFDEIGKLEVMSAGVTLKKIMDLGDTYKNLSIMKGTAVYTIDFSKVRISQFVDKSGYNISIPLPEMQLYLDLNSTEKLASKQKVSWTVSAKDGLDAYLNSLVQMTTQIEEAMVNYDVLMEMAKETAIKQVKQLANTMSAEGLVIEVTYQQEGDEE